MSAPLPPLPDVPSRPPLPPARAARAALLLQSIGWEPSQLVQLALYVQMPPARKISQMLRMRRQAMRLVRARLATASPDADLAALVRQHVAEYYQTY